MSDEENDAAIDGGAEETDAMGGEDGTAQEEDAQAEAEPPAPVVKALSEDDVAQGLSLLARTANGLSHAYVRLDVKGRGLTDITAALALVHLRFLDVSDNMLTDVSGVAGLPTLLALDASGNKLPAALNLPPMPVLQTAILARNQIASLDGFRQPLLTKLDLSGNAITSVAALTAATVPALTVLNVARNALQDLAGLALHTLADLDVSENQLKSMEGVGALHQLHTLRAAQNKIASVRELGAGLVLLRALDLRANELLEASDLKPLHLLPALAVLNLSENVVAETSSYRIEVLVINKHVTTLDDVAVGEEERDEAAEIAENRKGK